MAKVAFLGLGQMGSPMARRLVASGHDVTVWNRTPEKAEPLVAEGARQGSTPADAGQWVEAAVTMLADPDALETVLFGPDGLAATLQEGATLIDMSTVGPETVRRVAERLPRGVTMLDAPVLGTVPHAEEGHLKIFVGGPEDVFERWRPLLDVLGTPTHLGPVGGGASMKLVVNSTLGAVMSGIGEALALADALGLDEEMTLNVLADSVVGTGVTRARPSIESGTFPPRFKLSLARKDLGLVTDPAGRAGLELQVASAAHDWFQSAVDQGLGELDYTAVVAHIRGRGVRGGSSPRTRGRGDEKASEPSG
jgi:3-hydroxyisobutyrate dehydrogenase-like beta-hydroxyacid dehydrogenase